MLIKCRHCKKEFDKPSHRNQHEKDAHKDKGQPMNNSKAREYIPTPGPLPGEQWKPSNGTVGHSFLENECGNCARDKSMREGVPLEDCDDNECCPIIAASFRGEAVEWREMPDGEVKCIAFVEAGQPIPPPKDERTIDMFSAAPSESNQ